PFQRVASRESDETFINHRPSLQDKLFILCHLSLAYCRLNPPPVLHLKARGPACRMPQPKQPLSERTRRQSCQHRTVGQASWHAFLPEYQTNRFWKSNTNKSSRFTPL